jgi:hypothetical protein
MPWPVPRIATSMPVSRNQGGFGGQRQVGRWAVRPAGQLVLGFVICAIRARLT